VVDRSIPAELLHPVRRRIAEDLAAVEAKQVAEANSIASYMDAPVRFSCHLAVRGNAEFMSPEVTLDEYLEKNEPLLLVSCDAEGVFPTESQENLAAITSAITADANAASSKEDLAVKEAPHRTPLRKQLSRRESQSQSFMLEPYRRVEATRSQAIFELSLHEFEEVLLQDLVAVQTLLSGLLESIHKRPAVIREAFVKFAPSEWLPNREALGLALQEVGVKDLAASDPVVQVGASLDLTLALTLALALR